MGWCVVCDCCTSWSYSLTFVLVALKGSGRSFQFHQSSIVILSSDIDEEYCVRFCYQKRCKAYLSASVESRDKERSSAMY